MSNKLSAVGVLLAAVLATSACGGASGGGDDAVVSVATSLTASDAPFIIGSAAGVWDERGISVENIPMQGLAPALAGLANGSIQTVHQGPVAMAQANQKGAELRFFCGAGPVIWNGLIVDSDGPLAGLADKPYAEKVEALRGRNIGVSSLKSTTELLGNAMIQQAGLNPSDVSYVAVGYGEGSLAALEQGRVDAVVTFPFLTQQGGDKVELLIDVPNEEDAPADLYNTMSSGWFANKDWLDANPDLATGFCEAFGDALAYVTDPANADAVGVELQKSFGIPDLDVAKSVVAADGPLSLLSTELDCAAMERAITLAEQQGQLTQEPKMTCDNMIWKKP